MTISFVIKASRCQRETSSTVYVAAMYVEHTMPSQMSPKAHKAEVVVLAHNTAPSLITGKDLVRVSSTSNTPPPRVIHDQPGYVLPLLACFVIPVKMDPNSSGDGSVAAFLSNLLIAAGAGSLGGVRFVLTRSLWGRSSKVENISSGLEGAE